MRSLKIIIILLVTVISIFSFSGCLIDDVSQPTEVSAGGTFTTTLTITDMNAEQNNAHKGVVAILVPEDWSFISGTYSTTMGSGDMELDTAAAPVWGDVDTVIQRPAGMKWIKLLSDQGYLHDANMVYETTINLQVGQTAGTFAIGYLVTVNSIDIMKFLNDQDVDQQLSGADTSMNHMVNVTPATAVEKQLSGTPSDYDLSQNYPNPFNPSTSFSFSLKEAGDVNISIYNSTGVEIKSLVNGFRTAGNYQISFDAHNLPSGIYYYRIITENFTQTKKMLLLK